MFSPKADGPLTVQIPRTAEDRPSWTRVGVIAAIGFIVGVAWPRLAGVRLGPGVPEAPSSVASVAAPAEGAGPAAPTAMPPTANPSGGVAAVVPTAAPAPAPSASSAPAVSLAVGHGVVFACRTSDGESLKGSDCGSLSGLDGVILPRLRKLADCPEASGASGKVHFVVHLDFPRGGLNVELGRGHGVSAPDALLACARSDMNGATLTGVTHDNPRYSVAYTLTFGGGSATPAAGGSASGRPTGEGAGSAQVVWEVAVVRDAPKTGKVVARLQRGTELHVGPAKDGWYPVKFGDGFASEGWVYRGAIGK
jgi:hypothetical protein